MALEYTDFDRPVCFMRLTTAERDALDFPPDTSVIFNIETGQLEQFRNGVWGNMLGSAWDVLMEAETTLTVDDILELTPGHGVVIDNVVIADSAVDIPSWLFVDNIGDHDALEPGVMIDGVLLKDSTINYVDRAYIHQIDEHVENAGVTIDGVLIKDGTVVGASIAGDTLWDAAGDLAVGTGANAGGRLAITVPAGANLLNVLGVVNGETKPTYKVLFDATAPEAIGTAAAGTGVVAAHRNHVHAIAGANVHMITGTFYAVPESTTVPKLVVGPMPFAGTFVKLTIKSVEVAAESAIRVDLHKQTAANEDTASTSTTVFTTQTNRPTIAAAHYAGNTTTFEVSTFAKGDWLYFFVDVDDSGITVLQFGLEVTPT